MGEELFREGGPLNVRRAQDDNYNMTISLPVGADGRVARECPSHDCSPGYFKVKSGTGITGRQEFAFCPYCRCQRDPSEFTTKEQIEYAKKMVLREAHEGIGRMVKSALGMDSSGKRSFGGGMLKIEMSLKQGRPPHVFRPFEELLQRSVICPQCGLDHSVFGLAVWCADCGTDIFLTHVEGEFRVVRSMIGDVERRREILGPRVAARDIENCLEDVVSICEAVLRALFVRHLRSRGSSEEAVHAALKKIANRFQNVRVSGDIFHKELNLQLFAGIPQAQIDAWAHTFEKRHPITHNLGVVDRKYLDRIRSAEEEGREVMVSAQEINETISTVTSVVSLLHGQLFSGGGGNSVANTP